MLCLQTIFSGKTYIHILLHKYQYQEMSLHKSDYLLRIQQILDLPDDTVNEVMYVTSGAGIDHMHSNAQSDYLCNIQHDLQRLHNTQHEKMDVAHGMTNQYYCAPAHYKEDQKIHMPFDVLDSNAPVYSEKGNNQTIKLNTETLRVVEKNLLSLTKQIEVAKRKNDHKLLENLSKDKVYRENQSSYYKNNIRRAELQNELLNREKMEN